MLNGLKEDISTKTIGYFKNNKEAINASLEKHFGMTAEDALSKIKIEDVFRFIHSMLPFPISLIKEEMFVSFCTKESERIKQILTKEAK